MPEALRVIPGLSHTYAMFSTHSHGTSWHSRALLSLTLMTLSAMVSCKSYRLRASWKSEGSYGTKGQTLCCGTTGHRLNIPWVALRSLMLLKSPKSYQSPQHQGRAEDSAALLDPGLPMNFLSSFSRTTPDFLPGKALWDNPTAAHPKERQSSITYLAFFPMIAANSVYN